MASLGLQVRQNGISATQLNARAGWMMLGAQGQASLGAGPPASIKERPRGSIKGESVFESIKKHAGLPASSSIKECSRGSVKGERLKQTFRCRAALEATAAVEPEPHLPAPQPSSSPDPLLLLRHPSSSSYQAQDSHPSSSQAQDDLCQSKEARNCKRESESKSESESGSESTSESESESEVESESEREGKGVLIAGGFSVEECQRLRNLGIPLNVPGNPKTGAQFPAAAPSTINGQAANSTGAAALLLSRPVDLSHTHLVLNSTSSTNSSSSSRSIRSNCSSDADVHMYSDTALDGTAAPPLAEAAASPLAESADVLPEAVPLGLSSKELKKKAKALEAAARSAANRVLLSEARKRRQLERMFRPGERDMASASARSPPGPSQWAFWRKKKDPEGLSARQLRWRIEDLKRRKQLDQVFALLEEARAKGKAVNTAVMNAAMGACVHCGDVERALDLFDDMSDSATGGCGVDSVTYGTLIKGLGRAGRLDDAFEVLESMEAGTAPGRPELSEVHLNTLVNACADAGDARRARSVLQRFRVFRRGVGPSVLTYNLLIKGYARSDNPLEALKVVEEMQLQGLPLDRLTYNCLLLACVRGGEVERALDLLQEMKVEAWRQRDASLWPDAVSYTTLLKGLAEDGDLEGVLKVVQEMKEGVAGLEFQGQQLPRLGNPSSPLAGAHAGNPSLPPAGAHAAAVAEAAEGACALDRVAYSAVIDACLAVGSTSDALVFFREMEELARKDPSMRPRAHVFLALMRALAKRGRWGEAQALKERMVRDTGGRVWPEQLWEAEELVLEAALAAGEHALAEEQFEAMMARAQAKGRATTTLSERGTEAVVRLSALSQLPLDHLQPVPLRHDAVQVAPRAAVELLMRSVADTCTLSLACTHQDLEAALSSSAQPAVPVLGGEGPQCLGFLLPHHLHSWDDLCEPATGQLRAASLLQAPKIPRFAPSGDAAVALVSSGSPVLAVVAGSRKYQSGISRSSSVLHEETSVVGFIFKDMLF